MPRLTVLMLKKYLSEPNNDQLNIRLPRSAKRMLARLASQKTIDASTLAEWEEAPAPSSRRARPPCCACGSVEQVRLRNNPWHTVIFEEKRKANL